MSKKRYKIVKSMFSGLTTIIDDLSKAEAKSFLKDLKEYHEAERELILKDTCKARIVKCTVASTVGILTLHASGLPYGRHDGITLEYLIREMEN